MKFGEETVRVRVYSLQSGHDSIFIGPRWKRKSGTTFDLLTGFVLF